MISFFNSIVVLWINIPAIFRDISSFDHKFYKGFYGDLSHLNRAKLYAHYFRHGRSEGRYPNYGVMLRELQNLYGSLPDDFNAETYRRINADLEHRNYHLAHFTAHYLKHGREEGRRYKISNDKIEWRKSDEAPDQAVSDVSSEDILPAWAHIFSVSQFAVWNSEWLPKKNLDLNDAIKLFLEKGVEKLSPINLDYVFEPEFYRATYGLSGSDVDLYKEWLTYGFLAGRAPNESQVLRNLLGGETYPKAFLWQNYIASVRLPKETTKYKALALFFDAPFQTDFASKFLKSFEPSFFQALGNYKLIRGLHWEAVEAFKAAIKHGGASALGWHLLGDAYLGCGNTVEAANSYTVSLTFPGASVWAPIHISRLLAAGDEYEAALEQLASRANDWSDQVLFREATSEIIERYFQHSSSLAKEKFRQVSEGALGPHRAQGEEILNSALGLIKFVTQKVFNLDAILPPRVNNLVAILANKDLRQCTHYRVEQKEFQLKEAGFDTIVVSHNDPDEFIQNLLNVGTAIFYRVPATPGIIKAIITARSLGILTYYEVDDLIFSSEHYPDSFASFEGQITVEEHVGLLYGTSLTKFALSLCERAIASTPSLKTEMEKFVGTGNVFLWRNGLDPRNNCMIEIGQNAKFKSNKIRIFYGSGTKAHNADFNELVSPALLALFQENPSVELVIAGFLQLDKAFDEYRDRVIRFPFIENVDEYWSILSTCDINMAVLIPTTFSNCKSEIKWLESAILQIPSVVSDTQTYREIIENGVDGFLAATTQEWLTHLRCLSESPQMRDNIGSYARQKALSEYSLSRFANLIRDEFSKQSTNRLSVCKRARKRILISNVFYAPQSIGGATRVVEDNISYLCKYHADEFEITVVCSDVGVAPSQKVRFEVVNGISVIRVSTPLEVGMDLRAFNEENEPIFGKILDHVSPDLLHFHCIQRLTASFAKVALDRKIPYIVTLHDAWWISDHQFLIDQNGNLHTPTSDLTENLGVSTHTHKSIERRQKLEVILRRARRRLTVSTAFGRIYESAGIIDVDVTENGVTRLKSVDNASRQGFRVSLGHIGGRAAHKGAYLLESVLRQFPFDNLNLIIIDGRLPFGQSINTVWGTTPVKITGAYPQHLVADLYAELDVLLAVSIWPESYGLVSREAQSLGRWVIGSDRGAISESIVQNENGFIIDVGNLNSLKNVLMEIDRDPERYRNPPDCKIDYMRSSDDQAQEIIEIYRDI
ncbi:glycosyltransferase [Agrobacterium rubi]|uniref:glycosyltransferase n=1 Tax=Agrobacterium rubi TaxID=28099 RepID=UPI001572C272|nr:glycosyltransferase [Agrobacterium rubi]NTF11100.1 glycosyltransferase [Agrobacterium rubi]NTF23474.1 glycosyltransferase [Agrobacterium rubi]NTF30413.1 glycosyltransferase [Agrobacterium rubi]